MLNSRTLYLVIALAACKGGSAARPEIKPIGDSGFVVDAPADWKVEADMKDFYTVTSDHHRDGWAQVMVSDRAGAASLDDLVKSTNCTDPSKAIKETTAAGTFFVQCEGKNGSFTLTKIAAEATSGTRHASCHIDTDANVAADAAVCKSLRKK